MNPSRDVKPSHLVRCHDNGNHLHSVLLLHGVTYAYHLRNDWILDIPHLHIPAPVCGYFQVSGAIYQPEVNGCYHKLAAPIHGYPAYQHTTRKWLLFFNPNSSTPTLGHWAIADNLTAHVRSMAKASGAVGPTGIAVGGWFSWYNNTYKEEKTMHFAATNGAVLCSEVPHATFWYKN